MFKFTKFSVFCGCLLIASQSFAQEANTKDGVAAAAASIEALVAKLQDRSESYPEFIAELENGLVTIEQADETVEELITSLREATTQLEDNSEVDRAIDDYLEETANLIAEAEGSRSEVVRNTIPSLRETEAQLKDSDLTRAQMVIEARNLIRTLEQEREDLSFLIRANQVQQASALISANLSEFDDLLEAGSNLSTSLIGTVPR